MECHYTILGLNKDASQEDIKRAYKRLALKHHPDKNGGDDTMFIKINLAYQILSDPSKRQEYDSRSNKLVDFLNSLLKVFASVVTQPHPQPQKPTHIKLPITLEDLYFARIKKAAIRIKQNNVFVSKTFCISLLNYQNTYTFPKQGDNNSDLIIELDILPSYMHIDTVINPYDLYTEFEIGLYDYYYGINLELTHLDKTTITIQKTFKDGSLNYIIRNKGLPFHKDGEYQRGDLYVFFRLTNKQHSELPLNDLKFNAFLKKHFS